MMMTQVHWTLCPWVTFDLADFRMTLSDLDYELRRHTNDCYCTFTCLLNVYCIIMPCCYIVFHAFSPFIILFIPDVHDFCTFKLTHSSIEVALARKFQVKFLFCFCLSQTSIQICLEANVAIIGPLVKARCCSGVIVIVVVLVSWQLWLYVCVL